MANTTIDFLSLTGLCTYDTNIKAFIESKVTEGDAKSFKYVNLVDRVLKFYTINPISDNTVPAYEIELPEQDLSNLMALVKNATKGNLASFGDGGQVVDSGIEASKIATKAEVSAVDAKADENASEITTMKGQIDALEKGTYDDTAVRGLIQDNADAIEAIEKDYLKAADKTELEGKIATAQAKGEEALAKAQEVASDLAEEVEALEASDEKLAADIKANADAIDVLNGEGAGSVKKAVDDAINKFATDVTNDEVVNSYKELIDWAAEHGAEAAEMVAAIEANELAISDLEKLVGALPEGETSANIVAFIQKLVNAETAAREAADALKADKTEVEAANTEIAKKADKTALAEEVVAREALDARVVVVEGKAHEHSNKTVLDGITAEKVAAWDAAKAEAIADAEAKNAALETALKKYADDEDAKIESRVGALETASATHALKTDVQAISGKMTTAEGEIDTLQAEMDAVEAKAEANATAITNHATAIAGKASQSDLNATNGKVSNLETDVAALKEVEFVAITKEQINNLFN